MEKKKLGGVLLLLTLAFAFISCEFGPSENQRSLLIGTWEATAGNNTKVEMAVTESTIKFRIDGEVSKEHPYEDLSTNFNINITVVDPYVDNHLNSQSVVFVISNNSFTTSLFNTFTFLKDKVEGIGSIGNDLTFRKVSDLLRF